MRWPRYYRLIGQTAVPCSMEEWVGGFECEDRRVLLTRIGPFEVSTIFLGLDHNFSEHGPPILFETMTFLAVEPSADVAFTDFAKARDFEGMNSEDGRSATWMDAEERHKRAVRFLKTAFCAPGEEPVVVMGDDAATAGEEHDS